MTKSQDVETIKGRSDDEDNYKNPKMAFHLSCPKCENKMSCGMPWIEYPKSLSFTCAKCGTEFKIEISDVDEPCLLQQQVLILLDALKAIDEVENCVQLGRGTGRIIKKAIEQVEKVM